MSGFRRRRKNRKDRLTSFNRKMEDIDREEKELKSNRQPGTSKKLMAFASNTLLTEESSAPNAIGSMKTDTEFCVEIAKGCKTKLTSNELQHSSKLTKRALLSPRLNDRKIERNLNCKTWLLSDDTIDESSVNDPTSATKSKRRKIASTPFSSPAQLKQNLVSSQKTTIDDGRGNTELVHSNFGASPFPLASRSRSDYTRKQRSNCVLDKSMHFDGTKSSVRENVLLSSHLSTIFHGELEQKNTTMSTESNHQSDSDESFNMLFLYKKRQEENNLKRKQESTNSERSGNCRDIQTNNLRRGDTFIFSADDDNDNDNDNNKEPTNGYINHRVGKNPKSKSSRTPCRRINRHCEDISQKNTRRIRKSTSLGGKKAKRRACGIDYFDHEDKVSETYDEEEKLNFGENTNSKELRIPETLECDTIDRFLVKTEAKNNESAPIYSSDDDNDGFMSNCIQLPGFITRGSPKDYTSFRSKKESSPDNNYKMIPKMRARSEHERGKVSAFQNDDCQYESDCDALDILHPNLENPKFGPNLPMEPLLLSSHNGTNIQVPASLSRFLAPFQKEGIRFMYNCLARKSGVILGDEMGCGKTVQVISLLCALFNKTGTRKDFIDIQNRNSFVLKQIAKVQKLRDKSLRVGAVENVDKYIEKWKTYIPLSPWNPVMIIVPPTILDTWKNAFETFSHFSVVFYSSKTKVDDINKVLYGSADVLIVPKSSFQDKKHLNELEKIKWKLVVIDEFHNFKNFKAKISIHLRALKELHQPLILGMTGTPMQNNHTELWNLVDLVETNYFGTKDEFKTNIDRPITLGRHKCADPKAKARSEAASADLRRGLNKIYIKREKKVVLQGQLPEKTEDFILCDLSPLQKEVYKHVIKLPDFDLVKHGSRPCDCGTNQIFFRELNNLKDKSEQLEYMRTNKSKIINQSICCKKIPANPRYGKEGEPFIDQDAAIWRTLDEHCLDANVAKRGCPRCPWCCTFPCLTKLNKLSSHLGLLQASRTMEGTGSPAYIAYKKDREFAKVALAGVVDQLPGRDYDRNDGIMDDHFNLSGKLKVLNKLLEKDYSENGKVLLFSHSTKSLDLIENWLRRRGSFEYLRMDGSTPVSRRQRLADEFNNNDHIFLFLLSIKATGLGLNLTSANRVIMFDVSWNPSWEIQAQDRAHRIGQTRDVHVVRLISKGTIEEMIYLRQIYKEHLKQDTLEEHDNRNTEAPRVFRGVQGDKYRKGEIFGTENLLRFKEDGSFLYDIYDLRPESKSRGNTDQSGLEIHDSGRVSEALVGMTHEQKQKLRDEEDLVDTNCISGELFRNRARESCDEIIEEVPLRTNKDQAIDKMTKKKNFARNHQDLFRSDRGGAAINSGENGFEEEMGGQTQAAYEIYENMRENLGEEVEISEGEVFTGDDEAFTKRQKGSIHSQDQNDSIFDVKSESLEKIDESCTVSLRNVRAKNMSAIVQTNSNTTNFNGDSFPSYTATKKDEKASTLCTQHKSKYVPESNPEHSVAPDLENYVHENIRSKRHVAQNDSHDESYGYCVSRSYQTMNNITEMGYRNFGHVRTEFSAADLNRPMYTRRGKQA